MIKVGQKNIDIVSTDGSGKFQVIATDETTARNHNTSLLINESVTGLLPLAFNHTGTLGETGYEIKAEVRSNGIIETRLTIQNGEVLIETDPVTQKSNIFFNGGDVRYIMSPDGSFQTIN